jgi:hypothetical protein
MGLTPVPNSAIVCPVSNHDFNGVSFVKMVDFERKIPVIGKIKR